jgi:integrase
VTPDRIARRDPARHAGVRRLGLGNRLEHGFRPAATYVGRAPLLPNPAPHPTRAEVDAVLRVTDTDHHARDHHLVALAFGTGLRVHELVALGGTNGDR